MGIVCQICSKRPATTHLTEIDQGDGERREVHLCPTCIENFELDLKSSPPPISEILNKKPTSSSSKGAVVTIDLTVSGDGADATSTCSACGLTFAEFAVNNRFGCAKCYADFGDKIQTLLARYHGSAIHVGRLPQLASAGADEISRKRARLDASLRDAVAKEAYEKAAAIRDEIRKLDERNPA